MAEEQKKMVPTLGLTGVTVNAMALIAPGAFLWITFVQQAGYAYPSGMCDVGGHFRRAATRVRDRNFVLGAGQTLSRCGQFLLVCGAGIPQQNACVQVRPDGEIRDRMVVASVLLDVSGRHGRHHGHHDRIHRRQGRAGHDERRNARPGIHGAYRDNFRVWRGMDRVSGRQRFHDGQYCHQRNPDRGAAVLRRVCDCLPARTPAGSTGLALDGTSERSCTSAFNR